MAGTKFTKRNLNRYRKVYPYIRRRPVNKYVSDENMVVESYYVTFADTITATHTFQQTFPSAPYVTAVAVDNLGNSTANVNVFVTAVSATQVTFEISAPARCRVHFHAIYVGDT